MRISRVLLVAGLAFSVLVSAPSATHAKVLIGPQYLISQEPGVTWANVEYDAKSNRYLAVWGRPDPGVFGRVLDAAGQPVGGQFRISDDRLSGSTAGPGGEFLVLSSEAVPGGTPPCRLVGRRLGPAGQVLGAPFVVSESTCGGTAVYNPIQREYLVMWNRAEVHVQRLSTEGIRVGPGSVVSATVPTSSGAGAMGGAAVAHNPVRDEYLVAWDQREGASYPKDERRIRGQRLDAHGAEIGADDFPISGVVGELPSDFGLRWVSVAGLEHDPVHDRYLVFEHNVHIPNTGVSSVWVSGAGSVDGRGPGASGGKLSNAAGGSYLVDGASASFDLAESRFYWVWTEDLSGSRLVDFEIFASPLSGSDQVSDFSGSIFDYHNAGRAQIVYNLQADEHLVVFTGNDDDSGQKVFARRIGNPPAPQAQVSDRRAPRVTLSARRRQRVVRRRGVIARVKCDEPCSFNASARVVFPGASKSFGLVRTRGSLVENKRTRLKLRLSRANVRRLRRAHERRRSLRIRVTLVASDAAGNPRTVKRTIRALR